MVCQEKDCAPAPNKGTFFVLGCCSDSNIFGSCLLKGSYLLRGEQCPARKIHAQSAVSTKRSIFVFAGQQCREKFVACFATPSKVLGVASNGVMLNGQVRVARHFRRVGNPIGRNEGGVEEVFNVVDYVFHIKKIIRV